MNRVASSFFKPQLRNLKSHMASNVPHTTASTVGSRLILRFLIRSCSVVALKDMSLRCVFSALHFDDIATHCTPTNRNSSSTTFEIQITKWQSSILQHIPNCTLLVHILDNSHQSCGAFSIILQDCIKLATTSRLDNGNLGGKTPFQWYGLTFPNQNENIGTLECAVEWQII
jgi:hypothetical protein